MSLTIEQIAQALVDAGVPPEIPGENQLAIARAIESALASPATVRDQALEEAALICDMQAKEPECPERAQYCAEAIRALKGSTAAVQQGEVRSERAVFEAWMSDDGQWPQAVERDSDGDYLLSSAANAWTVWRAAWAAKIAAPTLAACAESSLFCDLKTDDEKSAFFLSGRAYETGVIARAIQNDVAMAYHRCAEYQKTAMLAAAPNPPAQEQQPRAEPSDEELVSFVRQRIENDEGVLTNDEKSHVEFAREVLKRFGRDGEAGRC